MSDFYPIARPNFFAPTPVPDAKPDVTIGNMDYYEVSREYGPLTENI